MTNAFERTERLPQKETLLKLGLKEGDSFMDIGAGRGYFSITASEIVGNKGKVFAVDNSKTMLQKLTNISKEFKNIVPIVSDGLNVPIDEKADFAFMSHTLHEVKNKNLLISSIKKNLKSSGRLAIIEFDIFESKFGVISEHRLSKKEVLSILKDSGFEKISEIKLNNYPNEYCLVAENN